MQYHKKLNIRLFPKAGVLYLFFALLSFFASCKKLVKVPEPVNTITTSETFSNDATATSAISSIYSNMLEGSNFRYSNSAITIFCGLSADELNAFSATYQPFQFNTLQYDNAFLATNIWTPAYFNIYTANAIIEGLQRSNGVSLAIRKQLTGEAKFLRAFSHFYLVNLFGDIPVITTTAWANTSIASRSPIAQVYQQIIADLKDAQALLLDDYSISGGERTRVNKYAATALLSRVYLYLGDYQDAEAQATTVINKSSAYNLMSDLNDVFKANNKESIWQLQPNSTSGVYTTYEGNQLIPATNTSSPSYYLTSQLLTSFDAGDKRKTSWTGTTVFSGTTYYYPYKYKVKIGTVNIPPTEYYVMLRLAEQYLIRAEAKAQQGVDLTGAITDLNLIRNRAGLTANLPTTLTRSEIIAAVAKERRAEFFAEWGHRWLDLRRTGQADSVLSLIKPQWKTTAKLFPIPLTELQRDPNLSQNPGY